MKVNAITFVLAAIVATVTSLAVDSNVTNLPLKFALASNAVDTLAAHGLWAPDNDSFTRGQPNVSNVNVTAENLKFEASGLDTNDLISITMSNQTTATADGDDKAIANTDVCQPYPSCCDQCHKCEEACIALLWCPPCLGICIGACQAQSYCKNNKCD